MSEKPETPGLVGKTAIVTGAARGIGRAIADTLMKNGIQVILSDILVETGESTARELGQPDNFVPCDITDPLQVRSLIETSVRRFGRLDIMVNNAGVNYSKPEERVTIDQYPEDLWHRIINVDLNGTFYCSKAAAIVMLKQKSGVIINISSIAGVVALRNQIAFDAAKAGIIKMTEAMACELGPHGIRVNTVSPGSTITKTTEDFFYGDGKKELGDRILSFIPQRRPARVEEIADAVLFLASDHASYINGHNLVVDGGWICAFNRDF